MNETTKTFVYALEGYWFLMPRREKPYTCNEFAELITQSANMTMPRHIAVHAAVKKFHGLVEITNWPDNNIRLIKVATK